MCYQKGQFECFHSASRLFDSGLIMGNLVTCHARQIGVSIVLRSVCIYMFLPQESGTLQKADVPAIHSCKSEP